MESLRAERRDEAEAARAILLWPHHPDMLHRPVVAGANPSTAQVRTWNVFRTLELMPPAFWLRRLNASLGLAPPRPAPLTARVTLWSQVPARDRAGDARLRSTAVDVLIETEHAVWALLVPGATDLRDALDAAPDALGMLAAGTSWHAGRRDCYAGLVVTAPVDAPAATTLVRRYQDLPDALTRRMPPRSHDTSNVQGVGLTTWDRLITIVRDAAAADSIDAPERAIARRVVTWWDALPP